jgi:hypothetical protein
VLTRAIHENRKENLLLISSLTDIATYAETHLETFEKAVGRVYMQGGYSVSTEGVPIPVKDAANNFFDFPAAEKFHQRLKYIPSDVYTRVAAYATEIPADVFRELGDTQHPIGEDLRRRYKRQGGAFYKRACGPNPFNNLTQERFLENLTTFYKKHPPGTARSENQKTLLPEDGTPLPEGDEIEKYLTIAIVYDALPGLAAGGSDLLAALDVLDTKSMANQTSIHKVIGTPEQDGLPGNPNIKRLQMAFVISTILKGALYNSVQNAPDSQLQQ